MGNLIDIIDDYFPAEGNVSVPLLSDITILFDRAMLTSGIDGLEETFFIEGPDTDSYVGPGFNLLEFPDNISQGDDFLTSPGYQGIVDGSFTFENVSTSDPNTLVTGEPYRTRLIFTPTRPLAALTEYTVHLPSALDVDEVSYSGYLTFTWTAGTGSIEVLPATYSTSILTVGSTSLANASAPVLTDGELTVVTSLPKDHAIEVDPELGEIRITFDKKLDPDSLTSEKVTITALPATDHPKASSTADGELAKSLEASDTILIIKI